MALTDLQLMAHLFRRAGFGAPRDELEAAVAHGYEATVETLLHPETAPEVEEDLLQRYYIDAKESFQLDGAQIGWVYRMINTQRPLEEKMTLFWHGLFATGFNKCDDPRVITQQIEMFRRHGLGNFRELLVELSRDPAMIFWLDNIRAAATPPTKIMGASCWSCSRWASATIARTMSKPPHGPSPAGRWPLPCRASPTAASTGSSSIARNCTTTARRPSSARPGRWNGEDIVNIIVKQPATARFIARHLYNFFVADEPQVPAWAIEPPRDPAGD